MPAPAAVRAAASLETMPPVPSPELDTPTEIPSTSDRPGAGNRCGGPCDALPGRMAEDPALRLTDVQFVLGHAQLTTTQITDTAR
jgi:hypothetical protein